MKNIVLTGFMGCGKTTVGQAVAAKLGIRFIDLDAEIERAAGISISDIFALHGEAYFRELETKEIKKVSALQSCVIATGGGAVINAENINALRKGGIIFYLKRDIEKIEKSLLDDTSRPMLKSCPDAARMLYHNREPLYENCDVIVDANRGINEITEDIIKEAINVG